ncbi:hypothetical protein BH23DEI1_BH23DEI1_23260 [soil metagenome]
MTPGGAMPRTYHLRRSQRVSSPLEEVYAYFSDAENLDALTPPFLRFRILTPHPVHMRVGTRIEYALALFGVPLRWRTHITVWEPGRRFVDEQASGPYASWVHTHTFEGVGGGTVIHDHVAYALPLGLLGAVAHTLFVRATLRRIFDFRHAATARAFAGDVASSEYVPRPADARS